MLEINKKENIRLRRVGVIEPLTGTLVSYIGKFKA